MYSSSFYKIASTLMAANTSCFVGYLLLTPWRCTYSVHHSLKEGHLPITASSWRGQMVKFWSDLRSSCADYGWIWRFRGNRSTLKWWIQTRVAPLWSLIANRCAPRTPGLEFLLQQLVRQKLQETQGNIKHVTRWDEATIKMYFTFVHRDGLSTGVIARVVAIWLHMKYRLGLMKHTVALYSRTR